MIINKLNFSLVNKFDEYFEWIRLLFFFNNGPMAESLTVDLTVNKTRYWIMEINCGADWPNSSLNSYQIDLKTRLSSDWLHVAWKSSSNFLILFDCWISTFRCFTLSYLAFDLKLEHVLSVSRQLYRWVCVGLLIPSNWEFKFP